MTMDMLSYGRNEEGQFNIDVLAGTFARKEGITRDQALNIINMAQSNPLQNRYEQQGGQMFNSMRSSSPSFWGQVGAGIETFWEDELMRPFKVVGEDITKMGNDVSDWFINKVFDPLAGNVRFDGGDLTREEVDLVNSGDYSNYNKEILESERVQKEAENLANAEKALGGFQLNALNKKSWQLKC